MYMPILELTYPVLAQVIWQIRNHNLSLGRNTILRRATVPSLARLTKFCLTRRGVCLAILRGGSFIRSFRKRQDLSGKVGRSGVLGRGTVILAITRTLLGYALAVNMSYGTMLLTARPPRAVLPPRPRPRPRPEGLRASPSRTSPFSAGTASSGLRASCTETLRSRMVLSFSSLTARSASEEVARSTKA